VQSIFTNQIKKRREQEDSSLRETMRKTLKRLGLQSNEKYQERDDLDAIEQILDALHVKNYKIEENELSSVDDQLKDILERNGIMSRRVNLSKDWWKDAQGPMLGQDKEGNAVALMPTKWGTGYKYTATNGKQVKINAQTNAGLKHSAICFYPALPQHKLSPRDLVNFSIKTLSKSNVVLLLIACAVVMLFGMFTSFGKQKTLRHRHPLGNRK